MAGAVAGFRRGCAGAASGACARLWLCVAHTAPAAEVCEGRLTVRPRACGAAEAVLGGLCANAGATPSKEVLAS